MTRKRLLLDHCSLAYSALALRRMGILRSASFQRLKSPIRQSGLGRCRQRGCRRGRGRDGKGANGFVEHNAALFEDSLELGRGCVAAMGGQIGWSAHIDGIQAYETDVAQFVGGCILKSLDGLSGIAAVERELSMNRRQVIEVHDGVLPASDWPKRRSVSRPGPALHLRQRQAPAPRHTAPGVRGWLMSPAAGLRLHRQEGLPVEPPRRRIRPRSPSPPPGGPRLAFRSSSPLTGYWICGKNFGPGGLSECQPLASRITFASSSSLSHSSSPAHPTSNPASQNEQDALKASAV
jgi:hypothetical protein